MMTALDVLEGLVYHPSGEARDEDAMTPPHSYDAERAECWLEAADGSHWLVIVTKDVK